MTEWSWLSSLGAASGPLLWLPVVVWTALALAGEAVIRTTCRSAPVGFWSRTALLMLLPGLIIGPHLLAPLVPSVGLVQPADPGLVARAAPAAGEMPLDAVPLDAATASARPQALADLAIGIATLAAGALSLAALAVLAGGVWWLMRFRRTLRPAHASVAADVRALSEDIGVRQPVGVVVAPEGLAPFTVGWRRPLVAVPEALTGQALQFALAHEVSHVRHGHFAWSLAERAVRSAFVWHPVVHVLARGLALDRERIADADVVGLWPSRVARYGRLLAEIAARPTPILALGASSSFLTLRLAAMTRPFHRNSRLAPLAGLAVFVLPLVVAASAVPDPAPRARVAALGLLADADTTDPVGVSRYPSDSLDAYVARQSGSYSDRGNRVQIWLKPGLSRAVAERVAAHYSDGDLAGTLVVVYDGGEVTRSSLRNGGLPPPPPVPPGLLAASEGGTFPGAIQNRSYYRDGRIKIRLKPGQPLSAANWIADWYSDGDRPGQIEVVYDGGSVERSTLRDDLPPPPPPPPAAPDTPPAPPPPPAAPGAPPALPPPPPDYSAASADADLKTQIEEAARTLDRLRRQLQTARGSGPGAETVAEMARIAAESSRVQAELVEQQAQLVEQLASSTEMRRQLAELVKVSAALRQTQQALQRSR